MFVQAYKEKGCKRMENHGITEALLSEVYRNTSMGSENLGNMLPVIKDKFLMRSVTSQMEAYSSYAEEAAALLRHRAVRPNKPSAMDKLMAKGGAFVNTLFESSDSSAARIIIKGTKMGADSLERELYRLEEMGAEACAVDLARRVVDFERREADEMVCFTLTGE